MGLEKPIRIYAGQYYDQETGLHYNYHRYYDPTTGRYLTPDPIGLAGGINPFTYVGGNPVNLVDPYGLFEMALLPYAYAAAPVLVMVDSPFLPFGDAAAGALIGLAWLHDTMPDNLPADLAEDDGSACSEKASEKTARDMAKQIERDLGKDSRRDFHDMKEGGDRSLEQLKQDAKILYEMKGKTPPKWMQ